MAEKKSKPEISFTQTYVVYASPEKVFDALTNPEVIAEWSGEEAKLDPVIGGDFEMFGSWVKGSVLEYVPSAKLSYTWKATNWKKNDKPSVVIYLFKKHDAGTEVVLEHKGFPTQEEADNHFDGWINYVFEPLNEFFTL